MQCGLGLLSGISGAAEIAPFQNGDALASYSCSPIAVHRKHDDKWLFP
jgi:hypothetical protein